MKRRSSTFSLIKKKKKNPRILSNVHASLHPGIESTDAHHKPSSPIQIESVMFNAPRCFDPPSPSLVQEEKSNIHRCRSAGSRVLFEYVRGWQRGLARVSIAKSCSAFPLESALEPFAAQRQWFPSVNLLPPSPFIILQPPLFALPIHFQCLPNFHRVSVPPNAWLPSGEREPFFVKGGWK